jgi:hypothetical protein
LRRQFGISRDLDTKIIGHIKRSRQGISHRTDRGAVDAVRDNHRFNRFAPDRVVARHGRRIEREGHIDRPAHRHTADGIFEIPLIVDGLGNPGEGQGGAGQGDSQYPGDGLFHDVRLLLKRVNFWYYG